MGNVKKTYSDFHKAKQSGHVYPTEWVIRTILGKYPDLNLDKTKYKGAVLLDLEFGDCRNMPLLQNCEFDIYGVEISDEIVSMAENKISDLGISATLKKGTNSDIPFDTDFFSYLLACHSCYYVYKDTFTNNIKEIACVLKPGEIVIASIPSPNNFILKGYIKLEDGHVVITSDVYGLRNGYIFRTFENEGDVIKTFSPYFNNMSVCKCEENFWGLQINYFLIEGEKI